MFIVAVRSHSCGNIQKELSLPPTSLRLEDGAVEHTSASPTLTPPLASADTSLHHTSPKLNNQFPKKLQTPSSSALAGSKLVDGAFSSNTLQRVIAGDLAEPRAPVATAEADSPDLELVDLVETFSTHSSDSFDEAKKPKLQHLQPSTNSDSTVSLWFSRFGFYKHPLLDY